MIKVRITEEAGRFIAVEAADPPLRYVAGEGASAAEAAANLLRSHADLVLRGAIALQEIR